MLLHPPFTLERLSRTTYSMHALPLPVTPCVLRPGVLYNDIIVRQSVLLAPGRRGTQYSQFRCNRPSKGMRFAHPLSPVRRTLRHERVIYEVDSSTTTTALSFDGSAALFSRFFVPVAAACTRRPPRRCSRHGSYVIIFIDTPEDFKRQPIPKHGPGLADGAHPVDCASFTAAKVICALV